MPNPPDFDDLPTGHSPAPGSNSSTPENQPPGRTTSSNRSSIPWSQDENPPPLHDLLEIPANEPKPEERAGSTRDHITLPLRGPNPNPFLTYLVILLSFVGILVVSRIPPRQPNANKLPNASTPAVAAALAALNDPNENMSLLALELFTRSAPLNPTMNSGEMEQQLRGSGIQLDLPEAQLRMAAIDLFQAKGQVDLLPPILERVQRAQKLHAERMRLIPHDEWPDWALQFENVTKTVNDLILNDRTPTPAEADLLINNLQSFGRMIVANYEGPTSPAHAILIAQSVRFAIAIILAILGLGGGLLIGVSLFFVTIYQLNRGRINFRLHPQQLFSRQSSQIFLEAFAVYFSSILLLTLLVQATGSATGIASIFPIVIGSIAGVSWPFLRGLPLKRAAFELGWSTGQGFFKEIRAGIAGYLALIPLYMLGILGTLIFAAISASLTSQSASTPDQMQMAHPIFKILLQSELWLKLTLFAFAAGFAPFFEETMFRGALYGSLRKRLPIGIAAPGMAFIFAAIHPQGFIAVPALMSLAIGFALLREWRGSLIAPMTAHALHNGFIVGILILIL